MGPNRPRGSEHFPRHKTFQPLTAVLIGSAPKAILGANADKWGEPGPRYYNHTHINGLAPFQGQETAITEQNCDKPSKPSRCMQPHLHFPSARSSYALMGCME